jgi:pyruvate/2-oxoglutarate dehydrogenase complex dihydrolipoamide dehydrogenase (E3) component
MTKYDALIIGFGKGGKTLAGALAGQGKKVAVVEKSDQMFGGTCINVGCIPTKSLVRSAQLSRLAGGEFAEKAARYRAAIEEKRRLTTMLRGKNYDKLNLGGVNVIVGEASFTGPKQVSVKTKDKVQELSADQVFINTGAETVIPPIKGVQGNPFVYTSESIMELEELPQRLVIVGGGYIGLEFASMYTNFGSQVTVLEGLDSFIPREDRDVADEIRKVLEGSGVAIHLGAKVESIEQDNGHAVVACAIDGRQERVEADAVLLAIGRKPNTSVLNCAAAGIELTPRGAVKTDEYLRTTASDVWAMGDVVGGLQFTYVSLDDYRIVWSQLSGKGTPRTLASRKNVPYSVFITPPFSRVGLGEKEAAEAGFEIKIAKILAAAVPKAQVLKEPRGFLKAIVDARTGKILGASIFCEESYEVINTIKLAMDLGADYQVLRDMVYTHPTMSEALNDLFAAVK